MESALRFRAKREDLIFAAEKHLGVKRLEAVAFNHLQDLAQALFRAQVVDNTVSQLSLEESEASRLADEVIVKISNDGSAKDAVTYATQFQALLERS